MSEYARAVDVYREIRAALGPWFKENGYGRWKGGSEPGWVLKKFGVWFRVNPWGGGAMGGSSFYGTLEITEGASVRQRDLSLCLTQPELDELREIQNAINRRRPRTPETQAWLREDSGVGQHTRDMYRQYAAGEEPYRVGDIATFGYFSVADVRFHTGFLARYLPQIVARSSEGQLF